MKLSLSVLAKSHFKVASGAKKVSKVRPISLAIALSFGVASSSLHAGSVASGSIGVGDTYVNSGTVNSLEFYFYASAGGEWPSATIINTDTGTITSSSAGILVYGGAINVTNMGTISGKIFTNTYGFGNIETLNNLQGQAGSSSNPLIIDYNLPHNYGIILGSDASTYGKITSTNSKGWNYWQGSSTTCSASSVACSGSSSSDTNFSVNSGSVKSTIYSAVISGVSSIFLNPSTLAGTYGGYAWTLTETSSGSGIWNLNFPGALAIDTQSSLTRLASNLRGSFNSASLISNFSNSNTYDCNLFDVKGMCISAGGRYSTVDNPSSNSSAAVVTLGYKVNSNIRIGGFLDQSVNTHSPTGIDISNKHPMMGAFAYWNQNADGLGYQVKVANAYQDKDLSTIRDVIGTSEAGRGNTSLNARSYVSELSYAFMYKENTLVRPYFALRHTTIEQDAYTETGVTTPLTYSALNDRTTSALMGVKFKHALTPKANLIGSLGVEQDLRNKTDRLTAAGVSGLTSENFSGNLHHTRPVASIGATYDIAKTQRLSGEVLVQQLPFQSTAGATAYFNYMIGF